MVIAQTAKCISRLRGKVNIDELKDQLYEKGEEKALSNLSQFS